LKGGGIGNAVGDLHGDLERTLWALQLAGVLSNDGLHRWNGGTTVTNNPNFVAPPRPNCNKAKLYKKRERYKDNINVVLFLRHSPTICLLLSSSLKELI
jgi:hypothetical protein